MALNGMNNSMDDINFLNKNGSYRKRFIHILTFFAAIGGFLFGYDTGVVSGVMLLLKDQFALDLLWQELIVSVTLLFAIIFAFVGGPLNNAYGRRPVIIMSSLVFTVGSIVLSLSHSKYTLLVGRGIVGIGIGLSSMTVPMYIAELSPPEIRGRLVIINNIFITAGQFIAGCIDGAFSSDKVNGWRFMLGLAAIPAMIQFIGFLFLPESPRWLIQKGKIDKAAEVFGKIFLHDAKINSEIETLKEAFDKETKLHSSRFTFSLMMSDPSVRRALVIGCGLQMFQQLCGINTVMYYSATIFQMSGVKNDQVAIWLAAGVAFINFICTLIGLCLVEKVGRRKLSLWSIAGVTISLLVLATGFFLAYDYSPAVKMHKSEYGPCNNYQTCGSCMQNVHCGFCYLENNHTHAIINSTCIPADTFTAKPINSSFCSTDDSSQSNYSYTTNFSYNYCPTSYSWIILLGMVLYLFCFAPGMGPIPWTINSEIYPQWCRELAISYSTGTNWIFNLLVSLTFLHVTELLTYQGAFLLYAGFAFIGFIFILCLLPETKQKPLEEIQNLFKTGWLVHRKDPAYHVILNGNTNDSSDEEDPLFVR